MATILIRNLSDTVKSRLRIRAAEHERSMEEEARVILSEAVGQDRGGRGLGTEIHALFAAEGGVDLTIPPRTEGPRDPELGL